MSEERQQDVLYNKYRPSEFAELVGQEHVTEVIKKQLEDNILPNCLILYGPPGVGKTSLARLIAKTLNPSEHGLIEKDSSLEGGKDVIRDLQSTIYNKPFIGEFKTYLFDEAHEISKAGFSSLLKVTEEPPAHVKFIFVTTEIDKIPLNIRSRCQCHSLNRLSSTIIRDRLKKIIKAEKLDIPEALLSLVVDAGSGSLRNSIVHLETVVSSYKSGNTEDSIAKTLGILGSKRLAEFISGYIFEDFKKMDSSIEIFFPDNTEISSAISNLQQYIIDSRYSIIFPEYKETCKSDVTPLLNLINTKLTGKTSEDSRKATIWVGSRLDSMYDMSIDLEATLKRTNNKEAALRRFVIRLAQSWK